MLDLSMILTANDWPETVSVASLTLAELPSPRVLPSSYFPTRIPFVTIQESMIRSLDWAKGGWDLAMNLWLWLYVYIEDWDLRRRTRSGGRILERRTRHFPFASSFSLLLWQLFYWFIFSLFFSCKPRDIRD